MYFKCFYHYFCLKGLYLGYIFTCCTVLSNFITTGVFLSAGLFFFVVSFFAIASLFRFPFYSF